KARRGSTGFSSLPHRNPGTRPDRSAGSAIRPLFSCMADGGQCRASNEGFQATYPASRRPPFHSPRQTAEPDSRSARTSRITVQYRCCRKDRKSTRLNSSHVKISYAVFCLKKKNYNILISCFSHI